MRGNSEKGRKALYWPSSPLIEFFAFPRIPWTLPEMYWWSVSKFSFRFTWTEKRERKG